MNATAIMSASRPAFLERADLRLLLFGGKGGVGKTTCAAAAALALAARFPDHAYLLASTDPAHSLRDCFAGSAPPPNLECRELDFHACLEQFKSTHGEHLRQIALRGTFLDEADVAPMLDLSIPGFDELMAFTDIMAMLERNSYACILLDTAPTGHTLRFLELPQMMRTWLAACDAMLAKHRYMAQLFRRGNARDAKDATDRFLDEFARSTRRLVKVLSNPSKCQFVPIVLAEAASISETAGLLSRLEDLHIAVSDIVVNRLAPAASSCPECHAAYYRQQRELARLVDIGGGHRLWGIPLQGGEVRGAEALARFWDAVDDVHAAPRHTRDTVPTLCVDHPAPLPGPDARMLLFAGKGGVGKTTLACATAIRLAQQFVDKEVLLLSTDPAHSLSDCLDLRVGPAGVLLRPRLTALEIDAEAEFAQLRRLYADEIERFFAAILHQGNFDLEFDRDVIERILDLSPPGLDEVMALLRAIDMLQAGKHNLFILDTAPTGHLIRLLETPDLMQSWLKTFFGIFLKYKNIFRLPKIVDYLVGLSQHLKLLRELLTDPRQGQLYVVTILTEMAYEETRDLYDACRRLGVHVPALFLNQATPENACSLCGAVAATEARVRSLYDTTFKDVPRTVVYRWGEPRGLDLLTDLGQGLYV